MIGKILVAVAVLGTSLAVTPRALAGVCGRGPWRQIPAYGDWGPESRCTCSDGTEGGVYASRDWIGWLWTESSSPASAGAGFEMETYDSADNRVFIPTLDGPGTPPTTAPGAIWADNFYIPWWARVSAGYRYSNRYRSVCITNLPAFRSTHKKPSSTVPWYYD
jgi:hypothetical protein